MATAEVLCLYPEKDNFERSIRVFTWQNMPWVFAEDFIVFCFEENEYIRVPCGLVTVGVFEGEDVRVFDFKTALRLAYSYGTFCPCCIQVAYAYFLGGGNLRSTHERIFL